MTAIVRLNLVYIKISCEIQHISRENMCILIGHLWDCAVSNDAVLIYSVINALKVEFFGQNLCLPFLNATEAFESDESGKDIAPPQ